MKKSKQKYHTKSHCKYMIKLHIIFVTKYRKHMLGGEVDDDMKQIIYEISQMDDSLFAIESCGVNEGKKYE